MKFRFGWLSVYEEKMLENIDTDTDDRGLHSAQMS